jgi:hypothetical protein
LLPHLASVSKQPKSIPGNPRSLPVYTIRRESAVGGLSTIPSGN